MYKILPETTELIDKMVTWSLTTCWLDIAYTWLIGIQFKRILFWLNGRSLDNIVQTCPYQYEIPSGNSLNTVFKAKLELKPKVDGVNVILNQTVPDLMGYHMTVFKQRIWFKFIM